MVFIDTVTQRPAVDIGVPAHWHDLSTTYSQGIAKGPDIKA